METMNIPMNYYYKGSSNGYLHLINDSDDGTIIILTDYGELIYIVTSGYGLEKVIRDLREGKYA